ERFDVLRLAAALLFQYLDQRDGSGLDAGAEPDHDLDEPEADVVAVAKVGRAGGPAVDSDGRDGGELARAGAAGQSGDQAQHRRGVGPGQPQVAAGHAADEEAALADLVDGRSGAAAAHLQADGGQRPGRGWRGSWHERTARASTKPSPRGPGGLEPKGETGARASDTVSG